MSITDILALAGLGIAVYFASWRWLRYGFQQHLLLGSSLALIVLWSMRAGLTPELTIHFLGVTAVTLILGWALALLAIAIACLGLGLTGLVPWPLLSLDFLTSGVIPVAVSWLVWRQSERWLPPNLFIYLFVAVFLAAALAVLTGNLVRAGWLWLGGDFEFFQISHDYLILLPLVVLSEALLNGFVMTGLVIMRPDWVRTYDDQRYLGRR